MQQKNVIFDFNGVLLWDSHLHELVWREYALKLRGTPLTHKELHDHFHGRNNKACFEYLLKREVLDKELQELIHERESTYKKLCLENKDEFVLSPGSKMLLDYLVKQKIPHTIATSAEKSNVDFFFKHLHLDTWFNIALVAYDDGSMPGKPAPDVYLKAANILHADPADCLVIEDAKSGIQAAYNAHIGTIVALGPREAHPVLQKLPGVSSVITNLGELLLQIEKDLGVA